MKIVVIPDLRASALQEFYEYHERISRILGHEHPFIEGLEKYISNLESGVWSRVPMSCITRRLKWLERVCTQLEKAFL